MIDKCVICIVRIIVITIKFDDKYGLTSKLKCNAKYAAPKENSSFKLKTFVANKFAKSVFEAIPMLNIFKHVKQK